MLRLVTILFFCFRTYTEITGGTVLGTNTNDNDSFNAIPLGFTFTYNGVDHTQVSIQTNAFIAFGSEVLSTNLPISSTTVLIMLLQLLLGILKARTMEN